MKQFVAATISSMGIHVSVHATDSDMDFKKKTGKRSNKMTTHDVEREQFLQTETEAGAKVKL